MKRLYTLHFLLLSCAALLIAGCGNNNGDTPTLSVVLDPLTVNFPAAGDIKTYVVTTDQPSWDCSSDQTWCEVKKDVNAKLRIMASSHTSTTAPTPAKVTVTAGDAKPVVITVTQDAYVPPTPTSKAIYVVGAEKIDGSYYAMQWKYQNGAVTSKQLSTAANSKAQSVCTDGTNVYVGGRDIVQPNSVWTATVWKNGIAKTQDVLTGTTVSEVNDVCLGKDGKVYAAGYYRLSNKNYACVWIDGVLDTTFPVEASTEAQHIACASDGTIYVLGGKITWIGGTGNETLQLWKNGVLQSGYLTDYVSSKKDLFVAGTDVHVVASKLSNENNKSYHWKNGVRQTLQYTDIDSNTLYAVYVHGTDVYVSGYFQRIWKNGKRSDSQIDMEHFAVASDGTFYATREYFYDGKFIHTGASANDLTPVVLSSGNDGNVFGIFINE